LTEIPIQTPLNTCNFRTQSLSFGYALGKHSP
jgi:hypothetical protein